MLLTEILSSLASNIEHSIHCITQRARDQWYYLIYRTAKNVKKNPEIILIEVAWNNSRLKVPNSPSPASTVIYTSTSNDFWLVGKVPRDQSGEASHFYFLVTYWTTKLTEHLRSERKAVFHFINFTFKLILSIENCQNGKLL